MKSKARIEPRKMKLPPILEIDEEGVPVFDQAQSASSGPPR